MGSVVVVQYITIDGIVEDPDGSKGTPTGGWAMRLGADTIATDRFRIAPLLDTGTVLFGRRTWQSFAQRWPSRSGGFADLMNGTAKVVVSRSPVALDSWGNSSLLDGDLVDGVNRLAGERDVVVIGSTSVVHALVEADMVDEYRLITVPIAIGDGQRLFTRLADLELVEADVTVAGVFARYQRPIGGPTICAS